MTQSRKGKNTHLGCHRELFSLFLDIPLGALTTVTAPASAPRKNPASPLTKPCPGSFRFLPAGPAPDTPVSPDPALSATDPCDSSIPRFSASLSARSSERSIPVMKLKSRSNADSVANSLRLR